jgi:predicted membrane chloride channel (bestrophin family)
MVSSNPLFRGKWTVRKFKATVINDIWPECLFFTLVATMVVLVSNQTKVKLVVANGLLTVLGTVLGLVISFRTSSAYERYQDGRKMWSNIITSSRNLAQQIWLHVPTDRTGLKGSETTVLQNVIEKKTMINLILAFAVAVKHFLRDERGVYYEDLYPLISFLPRFADDGSGDDTRLPLWDEDGASQRAVDMPATELGRDGDGSDFTPRGRRKMTLDIEKVLPHVESELPLKPARNPPEATIYDYVPFLRLFRWIARSVSKRAKARQVAAGFKPKRNVYEDVVESYVPLEILLFLSDYTALCMKNVYVTPAIATGMTNNLTTLHDTVSNLERICNTPLPFAYQVHLRMSLWLYLLFLPLQIYSQFGWITIPGTAFAAFLLLGFLEIGQEIENPFNYDLNDLDLDYFCFTIQRELHLITAHTAHAPSTYIFSTLNQPFAPADRRNARELTENDKGYRSPDAPTEPGLSSIRRTLLKGWKDVDSLTHSRY